MANSNQETETVHKSGVKMVNAALFIFLLNDEYTLLPSTGMESFYSSCKLRTYVLVAAGCSVSGVFTTGLCRH